MLHRGFIILQESRRFVERLTNEQAGRLFNAIYDYHEGKEVKVDDDIATEWEMFEFMFDVMKSEQAKKSQQRAEVNRRYYSKHIKTLRHLNTNQESERERDGDEEKRSKREVEEEKAKVKEHKKETLHTKKNETEETKQTELFEREAQVESQKPEAKRADKEGEAKPTPRFQKPSVADIAEYVKAKGYEQWVDPEAFWSYHENRDWKVGNHKMKSWHLAITTWMRNNKTRQQQPRRGNGTSVGERAYNMLHFSAEGHPEVWEEEERIMKELQKAFR